MNVVDIDLKSLQVLEALIAEKNVTRAAERVGLSQPAVSNSLAKLRVQLQDPLLIRTRQGMVPTTRALELREPIRYAMNVLQGALFPKEVFHPSQSKAKFQIASTDYAEWLILPKISKVLSQKAPNMQLEMDPMRERIPFRQLERGEIDLAVGYFTDTPESLFQQELFSEDFVCVAHKDVNLGKKITLDKFVGLQHVLVAPWGGMTSLADSILSDMGLKRSILISTTRFLVAPMIISETNYIVTLPRRVAKSFSKFLPIKIYEHPVELPVLPFRQIWHNRTHQEPAHKWFRAELAKIAKPL